MGQDSTVITLPLGVVGRMDLGRIIREVEGLDEFLEQAAVRKPGTSLQMPKTSKLLDELLQQNKINALVESERRDLLNYLIIVRSKAPIIHMSFSSDPPPMFTQKLVAWLRQNIHPLVLLHVGLQPNIGAGCILRSTNKYFDMSLRQHFGKQQALLMAKIQGVTAQKSEAPTEVAK